MNMKYLPGREWTVAQEQDTCFETDGAISNLGEISFCLRHGKQLSAINNSGLELTTALQWCSAVLLSATKFPAFMHTLPSKAQMSIKFVYAFKYQYNLELTAINMILNTVKKADQVIFLFA